ncbi:MAG: ribbon-helix-helix protein, CopG family [Deltaproteobacteria bacterium]|nr:ribbon-helix-helix protein, CopG family [Deltaproteobacteria bacterium]
MIYGMRNVNVQVRLPHDLDERISKMASRSKSSFIREAIEEKIERERKRRLEEQWIQALKGHPEDEKEAESWFQREDWGHK